MNIILMKHCERLCQGKRWLHDVFVSIFITLSITFFISKIGTTVCQDVPGLVSLEGGFRGFSSHPCYGVCGPQSVDGRTDFKATGMDSVPFSNGPGRFSKRLDFHPSFLFGNIHSEASVPGAEKCSSGFDFPFARIGFCDLLGLEQGGLSVVSSVAHEYDPGRNGCARDPAGMGQSHGNF